MDNARRPPPANPYSLFAFEHITTAPAGFPLPRILSAIGELASSIGTEWLVAGKVVDLAYTKIADVGFDNREGTLGILE